MNYYGTSEYYDRIKDLEEKVFSNITFGEPDRMKELQFGYSVKYYYYADDDNRIPGHAPVDGEICRLYVNEELIYEWKNTDGNSRMAKIIYHSDGDSYFVFDEDLYGYSVLRLSDLTCMHYIPAEAYVNNAGECAETFIWCDCYYNRVNNVLAVEGCYWACPNSVIVLDFSNPMKAVEAREWKDLLGKCKDLHPDTEEIQFGDWDGCNLICKTDDDQTVQIALNDKNEEKNVSIKRFDK